MQSRKNFFPPEWHKQSAIQLTWPHKNTDWADIWEDVTVCYQKIAYEISKRQKLIGQLKGSDGQGMFAFLGDLIENYTFDPLYEGDPQADALALKQKLEGKFTEI